MVSTRSADEEQTTPSHSTSSKTAKSKGASGADDDASRHTRPPYELSDEKKEKGFDVKYTASCYCGMVKLEIDQDPLQSMYCHCTTCQSLHGATYQWASVLPKDAVHFVKGAEGLHFYSSRNKEMKYSLPCKVSCAGCQAPLADEGNSMFLLFPGHVDGISKMKREGPFKGQYHMFYGDRVEDIMDGLPKFLGKKGDRPVNDAGEEIEEEADEEKDEGSEDEDEKRETKRRRRE